MGNWATAIKAGQCCNDMSIFNWLFFENHFLMNYWLFSIVFLLCRLFILRLLISLRVEKIRVNGWKEQCRMQLFVMMMWNTFDSPRVLFFPCRTSDTHSHSHSHAFSSSFFHLLFIRRLTHATIQIMLHSMYMCGWMGAFEPFSFWWRAKNPPLKLNNSLPMYKHNWY